MESRRYSSNMSVIKSLESEVGFEIASIDRVFKVLRMFKYGRSSKTIEHDSCLMQVYEILKSRSDVSDPKRLALFFDEYLNHLASLGGDNESLCDFVYPLEVEELVYSLLPNKENCVINDFNPGYGLLMRLNGQVVVDSNQIDETDSLKRKIFTFRSGLYNYSHKHNCGNECDAVVSIIPADDTADIKIIDFCTRSLDILKSGGVAIFVASSSFLYDPKFKECRQRLIDGGNIKRITLLSKSIFYSSYEPAIVVELSNKIAQSVTFVDATHLCKKVWGDSYAPRVGMIMNKIKDNRVHKVSNKAIMAKDYLISTYGRPCKISRRGYSNVEIGSIAKIEQGKKDWVPREGDNTPVLTQSSLGSIVKSVGAGVGAVGMAGMAAVGLGLVMPLGALVAGGLASYLAVKNKSKLDQYPLISDDPITKITKPVIVLSLEGEMNPEYIEASKKNPVVLGDNIIALKVKKDVVDISYLKSELIAISKSINEGAYYPILNELDLLEMSIPLPDMEDQEAIVSRDKAVVESVALQRSELELAIEKTKEDCLNNVRIKKHNLSQHISEINSCIDTLSKCVMNNNWGDVVVSPRLGNTVQGVIDRFETSSRKVHLLLEQLTKEHCYGKAKLIDLIEVLSSLDSTSVYKVEFVCEDIVEADKMAMVFICEDDLRGEIIQQIFNNAEHHGFTEEGRDYIIRIELRYDYSTKMYEITFSNNGKPLPKDMNTERFGIQGEKGGETGNTGIGGYQLRSAVEYFGGSYEVMDNSGAEFPVSIIVKLPKY